MRKIKGEIKRNFPRIYEGPGCKECYFYFETAWGDEGICDLTERPIKADSFTVCKHYQPKEEHDNG